MTCSAAWVTRLETEVKALLTKKGFTNVDLWKSVEPNGSGVGEAFEEGMFEPLGQDLSVYFKNRPLE